MLFFHHLFSGMITGLALKDILKQRYAIIICGIGSIIPDMFYKSLRWQFYFHSPSGLVNMLLLAGIVFCVILVLLTGRGKFLGSLLFLLLLGIYLHQIGDIAVFELQPVLDTLGIHPTIVFQTFIPELIEAVRFNFFTEALLYEITSFSEWLHLVLCSSLLFLYHGDLFHIHYENYRRSTRRFLYLFPVGLSAAIGIYAAAILLFSVPNYLLSYGNANFFLLMVITSFAGAFIIANKPFFRNGYPTKVTHLSKDEIAFWNLNER